MSLIALIDRAVGPNSGYSRMADTALRALAFAGVTEGAEALAASAVAEQAELAAKQIRDYWRAAGDYMPSGDVHRVRELDRLAVSLRGLACQQEAA